MKISIITVTYNSAATLSDAMESVLKQSCQDIEYLIIDGMSTDKTMEIVYSYEPKFKGRLKYLSEKDRGIYDAMNKGIAMATGDLIGFLNSDDYYTADNVVEELVKPFSNPAIEAVYGDIHFIRNSDPNKIVRYYSSKLFSPFWLRFGFMPAHPSFYVRKDVYERAGFYKLDYEIGSDFEMMVRLFKNFNLEAKYIPMDFVTMRMGGVSTRGYRSHKTLLRENIRACRANGLYSSRFLIGLKYLYKVLEFRWC